MPRRFRQVDVFGAAACTGNPVAVVLDAEGLSEEELVAFSVWTNLSECTFVLPPTTPEADYRVRIFSLRTELPFAGHPTLGTAHAWLDAGGTPVSPGVVVQECAAGLVRVRQEEGRLAFAAPALLRSGDVDPALVDELVDILGVPREQVVDTAWLDNGPGWVGLLLDSAASVLALHPDATDHPGRWDIGVIGPHPSGAEAAFELRAFFTEGGEPLREDPVTGSLNAAAAGWLIDSGRAAAPFVAAQGTAMGRQGRIHISVDPEGTLWVGGNARTVVSGEAAL
ncbi:PhzF family phenazine biosynthesis protein [Microbacterium kyungheense]|uniref:PhzF family phenazine biosynthesis protein n=1 Tax=Microbacterium kyungheense TaxID=1263636 RepID=A0A543ESA3_9MICO|nr:PhzF family phenazine biosynthesis protein [Microbacterium kyungheense]TQM24476.1 PhzF family phenazine biosynthesis protein [Microbacterium kyungheense]